MKKSLALLALTLTLALALTGCGKKQTTETIPPAVSPTPSAVPSPTLTPAPGDDSMEGGGAGGTNDLDNDGQPDSAESGSGAVTSESPLGKAGRSVERGVKRAADDIRDAAENAGRIVKDK